MSWQEIDALAWGATKLVFCLIGFVCAAGGIGVLTYCVWENLLTRSKGWRVLMLATQIKLTGGKHRSDIFMRAVSEEAKTTMGAYNIIECVRGSNPNAFTDDGKPYDPWAEPLSKGKEP